MRKFIVSVIFISLFFTSSAYAHPWRTDNNWGHTCNTDCELYWLGQGEYHYHIKSPNNEAYFSNYKKFINSELWTSEAVNKIRNNEAQIWKIDKNKRLVLVRKINLIMKEFSWFENSVEYNGYYMSLGHLYDGIQPKLSKNNYQKAVNGYVPYWSNLSEEEKASVDWLVNILPVIFANTQIWKIKEANYVKNQFVQYYKIAEKKLWKTTELNWLWETFESYDSVLSQKDTTTQSSSTNTQTSTPRTNTEKNSTKWTKSELESKIRETESLISSSKETYSKSQQVIQTIQDTITKLQWYNTQYESKISYTRSDYQYYIDRAKTNKDNEKQQLNVFYAKNWIVTSNTAEYDAIDSKYNKLISDLEYEMNNSIGIYQNYINNNNTRINELQVDLSDRTKKLEEFWLSIKAVEKNLEMYKSELAKV